MSAGATRSHSTETSRLQLGKEVEFSFHALLKFSFILFEVVPFFSPRVVASVYATSNLTASTTTTVGFLVCFKIKIVFLLCRPQRVPPPPPRTCLPQNEFSSCAALRLAGVYLHFFVGSFAQ